jgi:hypothetical protein
MIKTTFLPTQFRPTDFKRAAAFLLLFIAFTLLSEAQAGFVKADGIIIESDSIHQTVSIAFTAADVVDNLLVIVVAPDGHTVFLDNKYRFSGNYKTSVDMKNQRKGIYSIEITEDNTRIDKTIEIR